MSKNTKNNTGVPSWLIDFLTQIVRDGDWEHGNGESMTLDAQRFLKSLDIEVKASVNPSEIIECNNDQVVTRLELNYYDGDTDNQRAVLYLKSGKIKFHIELDMFKLMELMRGATVVTMARFDAIANLQVKNLKPLDMGRCVTLDPDTLGMSTLDESGCYLTANERLKK